MIQRSIRRLPARRRLHQKRTPVKERGVSGASSKSWTEHLRHLWLKMAGVDVIALSERRPLLTLTVLFSLWKAVLVLITCISPGIGYDTSSDLLEWSGGGRVWSKWVRWDAVYFTQMARNGHVYEQQWAFGIGISTILLRFSQCKLVPAATVALHLYDIAHLCSSFPL